MKRSVLLLVAVLIGCKKPAPPPSPVAGRCYAMVWEDSTATKLLPDTVLFDRTADSALAAVFPGVYSFRGATPAAKARLAPFIYAGWGARADSILVLSAGASITLMARLRSVHDSLEGTLALKRFAGALMDSTSARVHGRSIACP